MFALYIVRNSKKNVIILQRRLKEKKKKMTLSGNCSFNREDQNIDFLFWTTIYELRKSYSDEKLEEILSLSNRPINFIEFVNARTNKTW